MYRIKILKYLVGFLFFVFLGNTTLNGLVDMVSMNYQMGFTCNLSILAFTYVITYQ